MDRLVVGLDSRRRNALFLSLVYLYLLSRHVVAFPRGMDESLYVGQDIRLVIVTFCSSYSIGFGAKNSHSILLISLFLPAAYA